MNSHPRPLVGSSVQLLAFTFLILSLFSVSLVQSQSTAAVPTLCQFITPKKQGQLSGNGTRVYINNFSSNKCLRVANLGHISGSKIFLDECTWWRNVSTDQTYFLRQPSLHIRDGFTLTIPTGLRTETNCATVKDGGDLTTEVCKMSSLEQLWKFNPVRGSETQFLIQQVSSMKCLLPKTRVTTSGIKLAPCNSYETEQIWKICHVQVVAVETSTTRTPKTDKRKQRTS